MPCEPLVGFQEKSNRWDTSLEQLGVGSPVIMLGDRTNQLESSVSAIEAGD